MGVGHQIDCKLTSIARKYTQEARCSLCFLYSAGNWWERSKVKKTMIIQEYFRILVNIHSFQNLRLSPPVTRTYRKKRYIEK